MLPRKISGYQGGIYVWLLQVIIVLALASTVIWLSLQPKSPLYTIADVYVPALDVRNTTFPRGGVGRNSTIIFNVQISNPNKGIGIYYDEINFTLYYSEAVMGVCSIPSFYQGHSKTTQSEVSVHTQKQFWEAISNGTVVDFMVDLAAVVRYKRFCSKTKHHQMDLQAHVPVSSNGTIVGEKNIKLLRIPKLNKTPY
ncbi:hypothetical protein HHK36_002084 [Tetracentron sinense]|uniref:Late embryogenesis abundant protein LEA-2 subgroup domain-containing protein n=1 Tax=Tetracentron sinense TaxID=13715 RepID=A0A834ZYM2_TETSI|nr:hypothetical protein HHK36_002084 [Tetracentron sinense]